MLAGFSGGLRWSGIPVCFRIFHSLLWSTVKGFSEVSETEVDVFFDFSCFFYDPVSSVQSLSHVQLFVTPWTAACQATLSITNSRSLPRLMSFESVMPSNHLILCCPLLLLPSIFPSIRVFSTVYETSHRQGVNKWVWLCSNKASFIKNK